MIRINRNHPSIVAWSMCNEVFFSDKSVLPKVRTLLSQLVALTHELDPTRPAALAAASARSGQAWRHCRLQRRRRAAVHQSRHSESRHRIQFRRANRPGKYAADWKNLLEGPGDKTQPYFWRYAWRSGEVLWCMFDHGSIAGDEGRDGIVDYFRLPKRGWYWYRNEYAHVPPPEWPLAARPPRSSFRRQHHAEIRRRNG